MQSIHKSVLLHEVVSGLLDNTSTNQSVTPWYVDGTLGGAGHALSVAKALGGNINIIAFDMDKEAIDRGQGLLMGQAKKVILENSNFRSLSQVLEKNNIQGIDYILLDLGISSDELDNSGKGFTFQKEEPLLMTMGNPSEYPFTAKTIINEWAEEDIANVIFGYGEERFARRIARSIVNYRTKKMIETSSELAELIKISVPAFYRRGKIHPATKTFQALRIAVNDELNALKEGLKEGFDNLNKGGRMAVISFHSLEDRIVKEFFRKMNQENSAKLITKKPIVATKEEITENPRSRSAKLRIVEK